MVRKQNNHSEHAQWSGKVESTEFHHYIRSRYLSRIIREENRFIKVTPIMSGNRAKDTGQVTFDTDYVGNTQLANDLPNRDLLFSMSHVITLARFDEDLHNWFVDIGKTKITSTEEGVPEF